jgi:hypothetical protein
MLPATFFDYQKLLSTYYKPIPSGSVKQNHYFWVEDKNATTMYRLTHWNDENATTESMKHIINLPDRLRKLKEDFTCNMSMLTASGMKPIKQWSYGKNGACSSQRMNGIIFALSHLMTS